MQNTHITILLGTARLGARSRLIADWVAHRLEKSPEISAERVDVGEIITLTATVPPWGEGGADEKSTPWKDVIARTDALIIVSPEYNHGYPGELKLLLDSLYGEYVKIPCGIVSVSNGQIAGARMAEQLRLITTELGMIPMKRALHIHNVKETFNNEGKTTEPVFEKKLQGLIDDLVWFARVMKAAK